MCTKERLNFIVVTPGFVPNVGGVVALHCLAKTIHEFNISCKIYDFSGCKTPNDIFDLYASESDINSSTIVVYPEVVPGNPLNAKHVVRWILCEVGIHCPADIYSTWGENDFVYHYNTFNVTKNVNSYNLLSPIWINPKLQNQQKSRDGYCHIIRKGHKFHQPLEYIHPHDSLLLEDEISQEVLIHIFNTKKYLISYDPYSYISIMAALCGCVSIIAPLKNTTKKQWLASLSISAFLECYEEEDLKGIAYGLAEIDYAQNTLLDVSRQQDISVQYGKRTVKKFINDLIDAIDTSSAPLDDFKNQKILNVSDVFFSDFVALHKLKTLDTFNGLQLSRRQLAEQCLNLEAHQIASWYQGLSGKIQPMLLHENNENRNTSLEDQQFINSLLTLIAQEADQPENIRILLAAMLYYRADEMPLSCDLSKIPDWLLSDYLKYLFPRSVVFYQIEESEKYYVYMCKWIDYLHSAIINHSDHSYWHQIVDIFVQVANFIPININNHNLKDVYVKRAEIIEFFLKINGHELEYEFNHLPLAKKKIKLGIIVYQNIPSAETFATLPFYEYLSRDFEVFLYTIRKSEGALAEYCRSCVNHAKLLPNDFEGQINSIREDNLDILFFGGNVTAITNQMCLLASHRLARIQVTSGGSIATTGLKNMDYFISGTLTDPDQNAQLQYQEKLLQIPGTAHCFSYGNDEVIAQIEVDRSSLNISPEVVVFTSGANLFKIVPELFHAWAKIIAQVPDAVLMLLPYGPNWSKSYIKQPFEENLIHIFAEYGLSVDQLIILDPQPVPNRADVKSYYQIADIYLDSFPFAGTTSLIEPLQVGLPVIARQGNCFRSAMGAAMIQSLGIADLVATSEESYIQLAVNLGNNIALRQQKSIEVQTKMQNNPSFLDSRAYAAKIGALFIDLFDQYTKNAQNESLQLRDTNLMVFPDWNQSEESVGNELQQVIQTLATQPNAQNTTLLIDTTNIATEDAQMFLSSIAMNIMMEEDLDISEELGISLIEDLNNIQWENLLPRINSRIVMDCDDRATIDNLLPIQLTTSSLSNLSVTALAEDKGNIAVQERPPALKHSQDQISSPQTSKAPIRLHIGGQEYHQDWKIFDALPREEVDFIGNAKDLSQFADNSIAAIYTSHVLEHFHYLLDDELSSTLKEWHRVLEPGGELMVSVPNLKVICSLYVDPHTPANDRYHLMRMIFGGQLDEYDVHKVGFDQDILGMYLQNAGFRDLQVVSEFGLFNDCSSLLFGGVPISLNMIAKK